MTPLEFADPAAWLHSAGQHAARADVIHLYPVELTAAAALLAHCRSLLSPAERERADRFAFQEHASRYTLAHAITRHILGQYAGVGPDLLAFATGPSGKPSISSPERARQLSFNLSHSHERALLAVSTQREIGVDLEKIRPDVAVRELSEHYFAPSECAVIAAAQAGQLQRVFFRHWVAKEAVLKAQGIGLGFDLHRFGVAFSLDGSEADVYSEDHDQLGADWRVRMLEAGPEWTAAVCARAGIWRPELMRPDRSVAAPTPPAPGGR